MAMKVRRVYGPTFEEMLHPERIPGETRAQALEGMVDLLDPVNLFNITWKDAGGRVRYVVLDKALTGVEANIVLLYGAEFPTGSHKVGAAYAVAMEGQLAGDTEPEKDTLVWPSTGNYGIGGAWVGPRLGYKSVVILPERVSRERFERIASYGARYIKTPGRESSVKEVFDACSELAKTDPDFRVLNQFQAFPNYRFHYAVTGGSIIEAVRELAVGGGGAAGIGNGRVAAFVSAMGSGGTIAAGDKLKQVFGECRVVGLEPIQCPTLFLNGHGDHDIQGIGDKHVTWIHNTLNTDLLMCLDDVSCKQGLQLLTDPAGQEYLASAAGVAAASLGSLAGVIGISAVCNILGAIKTAKFYGFGPDDNVVTIATDSFDRYGSVVAGVAERWGKLDRARAAAYFARIFEGAGLDWIQEGDRLNRMRWHNLKYFWWVEQHGKTKAELDAMLSPDFWAAEQAKVAEFDRRLKEARGF
jgi:cysteine synthase A